MGNYYNSNHLSEKEHEIKVSKNGRIDLKKKLGL